MPFPDIYSNSLAVISIFVKPPWVHIYQQCRSVDTQNEGGESNSLRERKARIVLTCCFKDPIVLLHPRGYWLLFVHTHLHNHWHVLTIQLQGRPEEDRCDESAVALGLQLYSLLLNIVPFQSQKCPSRNKVPGPKK